MFLGGVEVRAYHFGRGHTNGDTVIYFPDLRVIHTGDLITEGMPVLDYRNGASAVEWVKVLDKMLEARFRRRDPGTWTAAHERARAVGSRQAREDERADDGARAQGRPKESVFAQLGLADLGWDKTVSTVAFTGGLSGYYDEMKAQIGK